MRSARRVPRLVVVVGVLGAGGVSGCDLVRSRPAWELPPPPARERVVTPEGALTRAVLENGLHVFALADHRLPRVSAGVTIRRGAASEPQAIAGVARFTAEMMKRGAGERDALALARGTDELGAELSVAVDWDTITVSVAGLARDLDTLVAVLADVVLRPRFDPAEARRARAEQLAALEQSKDDPGILVARHAMRALYPAHRYGTPLEGTPASVDALDAAAATEWHRRHFVPNDAIAFAAGDIEPDVWMQRVRAAFGSNRWRRGPEPAHDPAPPARAPAARRVVVVDRPDLVQARIVIAHEGIARIDPRRVAAELMNNVLGGSGFSSRLMATARSEAGLTYAVWSGFSLRRHPGPFQVVTFTRVPEAGRMVELLLAGMEGIDRQPPTAAELEKFKGYTVGRFGRSLESSEAVMGAVVGLDVYGLPEDSLDTFRSRVRAVTVANTTEAARDLIHPARAAIVVLGPAKTLAPQLAPFGAVEVVSP